MSAPDVNVPYDGQPHGIIVTVIDPAVGAIVAYGTSEGTCDLPESPTITDVGTLTVYYQVSAANYSDFTGSATVTVSKAESEVVTPPAPSKEAR